MITLPPAICFDLDDTLLCYDAAALGCWERACAECALPAGLAVPALLDAIRRHSDWYWSDLDRHRTGRADLVAAREQIVVRALSELGHPDATLARALAERRQALHEDAIHPFPGAISLLQQLRGWGVRLALITNGAADAQTAKLERFRLRPYFNSIVIEGLFGTGKPDPHVFHHTLAALGTAPEQTWMIGDNLAFDIAPAHALGMTTIWYDKRRTGLPKDAPVQPHRIITRISELIHG